MIKLLLKSGEESRELTFLEPEVSIGRSSENVLQLPDKKVSRKHAKIEKVGEEYRLVDLGSGNGVRVNGREVPIQALAKGDEIKVGLSSLFVLDLDTPAAAAAPAAALPVAAEAPPAAPAPVAPAVAAHETERHGPRITRRSVLRPSSSSSGRLVAVAAVLCIVGAIGYAVVLYKDQIFAKAPDAGRPKKAENTAAKESADRLKEVKARAASPDPVTEAFVTEVSELNDRHGQVEPEFAAVLGQLRERLAAQIGKMTFAEVETRVTQALKERKYGEALESLKPLKKGTDATAAGALMEKVLTEIRIDYQSVRELGKRLEEQKQYTLASTHYRDNAGRFRGTEHYRMLSDKPAMLDLMAKAELEAASRPSPEVALAKVEPPKPAPEPAPEPSKPEPAKPAMEPPKPMAKPAMDPPKPAPKPPEPPKPAPKPPEPPKPEAAAPEGPRPAIKKPAVLCDCKRISKGLYCVKCERTLEPDDLRKAVCKRCEEKPKKVDMCVKRYFQAECHPEKVDDKPVFC